MSNSSELHKVIRALAEELADKVIRQISKLSVEQLAGIADKRGRSNDRSPAKSAKATPVAKGKAAPAKAKAAGPRRMKRRKGNDLEALRQGVLTALKKTDGWVKARDIAESIGDTSTGDLAFPIAYLRKLGLVEKKGDRSLATYRATGAGRSFKGELRNLEKSAKSASSEE
ncbi:MAG: hypothetical protein Q8Q09_13230 [Deltaproteobacteria bacterium]|nr:hypothetical protein [Deltaproteobacteria bacterium]